MVTAKSVRNKFKSSTSDSIIFMRCKRLLEGEADVCQCSIENQTVSEFSPGVVGDDEDVARNVYSPIHINNETGEVLPTFFSDVKDKGLSVNRIEHVSAQGMREMGLIKLKTDLANGKTDRTYEGFVRAKADNIRAVSDENGRSFCVLDTALEGNVSHADVCQSMGIRTRSENKEIRKKLYDIFSGEPQKYS